MPKKSKMSKLSPIHESNENRAAHKCCVQLNKLIIALGNENMRLKENLKNEKAHSNSALNALSAAAGPARRKSTRKTQKPARYRH